MTANSTVAAFGTPATARQPGSPWTIAEAATFLKVCRATVERACRAKRIRATRFGRRVAISDDELRRVVAEGF